MPRFLLDENVPIRIRDALKARGFEVVLVTETLGVGVRNHDIAELAKRSKDIVVTFDEDFLRLRPGSKAHVKVIYVQMHSRDPRKAERLLDKWIDKCLKMLARADLVRLSETGPKLQAQ